MSDTELEGAVVALTEAPGPVPWYATKPPRHKTEFLAWRASWKHGASSLAGANFLLDGKGAVFLVLPRMCYAQLIDSARLLCWQSSKDSIVLRLFNTDAFDAPLADSISAVQENVSSNTGMLWESGLVWEDRIPREFEKRRYVHEFPSSDLGSINEVLVLANGESTQLYQLLPNKREVAVYPQEWFNEGPYDFGYQWPTLVARDEKSQAVVGWGVRLGVFMLDSTLCNLKAWLHRDAFAYYPPYRR